MRRTLGPNAAGLRSSEQNSVGGQQSDLMCECGHSNQVHGRFTGECFEVIDSKRGVFCKCKAFQQAVSEGTHQAPSTTKG